MFGAITKLSNEATRVLETVIESKLFDALANKTRTIDAEAINKLIITLEEYIHTPAMIEIPLALLSLMWYIYILAICGIVITIIAIFHLLIKTIPKLIKLIYSGYFLLSKPSKLTIHCHKCRMSNTTTNTRFK